MRICLMIEGQEDVTWGDWVALASAAEGAGLEALFRSDHYLSVSNRTERGSSDAWTTIAALAVQTKTIRLGTLVSPTSFRHPSILAKSVVTADHISSGRVELGMGAGWHRPEHLAYGFPFESTATRLEILEEQIEIVRRQWREGPFDFRGEHYAVDGLDALPKPLQDPGPNLIVGGSAGRRSAALAAKWADEYNTVFASPETCRERREVVEEAWAGEDRDPSDLTFSLMTGCVVGEDETEVNRRCEAVMRINRENTGVAEWRASVEREWVIGTIDEARGRIAALEDAGVDRVMLQHLNHTDTAMVPLLATLA